MTQKEILRIVCSKEKLKSIEHTSNDYRSRCLNVSICPDCGGELSVKNIDHPIFTRYAQRRGIEKHRCQECARQFTNYTNINSFLTTPNFKERSKSK